MFLHRIQSPLSKGLISISIYISKKPRRIELELEGLDEMMMKSREIKYMKRKGKWRERKRVINPW